MEVMLGRIVVIDQDIIEVRSAEHIKIFLQSVIDIMLKRDGTITESKRHDKILIQAKTRSESGE